MLRSAGLTGPPVGDVVALVAVLFLTFTLQFFQTTAAIPAALRLTPAALDHFELWRLASYPLAGFGAPDLWLLLELLVLYSFAQDVFRRLGRRRFWTELAVATTCAALAATGLDALLPASPNAAFALAPFQLLQGQRILLVVVVAAFAMLYSDTPVLLFFVLPVPARAFLWLGVLFGFVGFLSTRDLAGFAGICAATAVTWARLRRRGGPPSAWVGTLRRRLHELALRRRRGRLRVVDRPGTPPDITIN